MRQHDSRRSVACPTANAADFPPRPIAIAFPAARIQARRTLAVCLLLLAVLAGSTAAARGAPQPQDVPCEQLQELRREVLIPALEELASWCDSKRLFAQRTALYTTLLELDPDHARARRGLKYKRARGQWIAPTKTFEPQDRNPRALRDLPAKRAAVLAPYGAAVLACLREHDLRPWDPAAQELLGDALSANPDDETIRALLGEVHVGDAWVLEETFVASLRRRQMHAEWASALERAAGRIEETAPTSEEESFGVDWKVALSSDELRVLATTSRGEARRTAEVSHAAGDFLRGLFDSSTRPARGAAIYLLDSQRKHAFLAGYPELEDDERSFYAELVGAVLPGGARIAQWGVDEAHRLDAATRCSVDAYVRRTFWIDDEPGWIWEGLGSYLTWRMTGTRFTWRVEGSGSNSEHPGVLDRRSLFSTAQDWLSLAHGLFAVDGELELDLASVLQKDIDEMNAADLLASYAFAAYLVEGRTELNDVLRRIGRGQDSVAAVAEVLDMDFPELEWRVRRWLGQQELAQELVVDDGLAVLREGTGAGEANASILAPAGATPRPALAAALSAAEKRAFLERVAKLGKAARERLVERCVEAARASGAPQVELVQSWLDRSDFDLGDVEPPSEFSAHDPRAYRDRSKRTLIGQGHTRWEDLHAQLPADDCSRRRSVRYELATGKIVATGAESAAERSLCALLDGALPDQDLAEALVQRALDRAGAQRKPAEYFAHLYSDVSGNAYARVTLFDLWANELEIEVPDVDVRAYAATVWDAGDLPIPLPQREREMWHERMQDSALSLRAYRLTLESLSRAWFAGTPELAEEHERAIDALHATIAEGSDAAVRLRERLDRHGDAFLLHAREDFSAATPRDWDAAYERRTRLDQGREQIRQSVLRVLADEELIAR